MRPPFIVIEGPDGAGKSTQTMLLAQRLRAEGVDCVTTCEPTTEALGQWARREGHKVPWMAAAMVFAADRIVHGHGVIRRALDAGSWVICDRYALSNFVYSMARAVAEDRDRVACPQCAGSGKVESQEGPCDFCDGSGAGHSVLNWLALVEGDRERESINIVIDVPRDEAVVRMRQRGTQSAYDRAAWATKIQLLYHVIPVLLLAKSLSEPLELPCVMVDGRGTIDEVAERVWAHVAPYAAKWKAKQPKKEGVQ